MSESIIQSTVDEALWLTKNLPIRLFGDPVLRESCSPISNKEIEDGSAQKWADQMIDFLKKFRAKTGAGRGLAANQIGISKQMILVWLEDGPKILINPKVIRHEGQGIYPESCISAASLIIGEVRRPWKIEVEYSDLDGKKQKYKADPIHSRLLLHEIDHLKGIVCADKYTKGTIRIVADGKNEV